MPERRSLRMLGLSVTAIILCLLASYLFEIYPSSESSHITLFSISTILPSSNMRTVFIPFLSSSLSPEAPWTKPVRVHWRLDNQSFGYHGTVDTGSTGVILSAADLEGYNRTEASAYPVGWQFLTSSKILYVGNWIPRTLTFFTGNAGNITVVVPILAVTKKVICPGYNKNDGPVCPPSANGTEIDMPEHIVYLGIGFGRQYNGQVQGNPDKNPFLNIVAINGEPISPSQMHTGYVITDEGIHIGLTNDNTKGFEKIKLIKQTAYSDDDRDWTQTASCITVGKGKHSPPACVNATMLVDTGITQMYLTIPTSIPVHRVPSESPSRPGVKVPVLANNHTVSVQFGSRAGTRSSTDGKDSRLGYSFMVGDEEEDVVPTQVITTVSNIIAPFANTGRHFLRRYDVMFDAKEGWFGVRRKSGQEKIV